MIRRGLRSRLAVDENGQKQYLRLWMLCADFIDDLDYAVLDILWPAWTQVEVVGADHEHEHLCRISIKLSRVAETPEDILRPVAGKAEVQYLELALEVGVWAFSRGVNGPLPQMRNGIADENNVV